MDFLVMRVFVKIWWIFPFTFVFSLLFAIRETVKDGPNDLKYALAAAVSLFILVAVCISSTKNLAFLSGFFGRPLLFFS